MGSGGTWTVGRAGARGLVAAMAMTGFRTVTDNAGLLRKSPPQAIVDKHAPEEIRQLGRERRTALTELAHWAYGTGGGVMFGLLPEKVRAHAWTGPTYGLVIWLAFEAVLAPLLDLEHTKHRGVVSRIVIAADHVLYGLVVAGRLAPDPHVIARERWGVERFRSLPTGGRARARARR